jgi:cell division septum initiation protein DivIVA
MTDRRMKGRVKGLLGGGTAPDEALLDHTHDHADPDAQRALHVLTMAQRTAEEHVTGARHQADTIRADARAAAEQTARDAQAHADGARRESAKTLADARGLAEQIVREARAHADGARRDAEKIVSDARATAQETAKDAQAHAAGLEREAQRRYDDVVGSLSAKRDALQQQIDELQEFDREYRSRLRSFMQAQLRSLGADEPPGDSEIQQGSVPTSGGLTSTRD